MILKLYKYTTDGALFSIPTHDISEAAQTPRTPAFVLHARID